MSQAASYNLFGDTIVNENSPRAVRLEMILAELRKLQYENVKMTPTDLRFGLCDYMIYRLDFTREFRSHLVVGDYLREAFRSWPEGSGDDCYPVPASRTHKSPRAAHNAYNKTRDLWSMRTQYGLMRWRLVDYLADYFAAELAKELQEAEA